MKSAKQIGALAVIMLAMIVPAAADVIADQSRISPFGTKMPGYDQVVWTGSLINTDKY